MEFGTSVVIAISYLAGRRRKLTALGLVFSTLTTAPSRSAPVSSSAAWSCLGYTIWGGMWSVAMTDLFSPVMILVDSGLSPGWWATWRGGPAKVIAAASEAGKLEFWPKGGTKEWLAFVTAFLTPRHSSIPQQDISSG